METLGNEGTKKKTLETRATWADQQKRGKFGLTHPFPVFWVPCILFFEIFDIYLSIPIEND